MSHCADNQSCPNGNCPGCKDSVVNCNDPSCYPYCRGCGPPRGYETWVIWTTILIIIILLSIALVIFLMLSRRVVFTY